MTTDHPDEKPAPTSAVLKRVAQVGVNLAIMAAALFASSGRPDWAMAWVYLGTIVIVLTINGLGLFKINPQLVAERTRTGAGTPGWDRALVGLYFGSGVAALLISGLDARFGWSQVIPSGLQWVGLALFVLGDLLASWAMWTNAYFATTVRLQNERGHIVVSTGPYRYVRHPGYIGWIVCNAVVPLILDSVWAFIPAGLTVCVVVVRTVLEDRTLQKELEGYREYAEQVRYRLVPRVW